ncbi:MAG: DUF3794 domain-containing protein [Prevotella sp.]|nr:DUF3794 domain-containing protein [Alistipes senegalensis]MCM1358058.1 DUF3794 domain-containing protein [Prevotella sp.]MCM1473802.1 DUF3794 domain-containing protein [Muribaculaceae bacterium]MDE6427272.1 DUF3794 domain-containing protein [Ruminococcus sp.]
MDLRINRETVPVSENIFDGVQEQGVELDYILPDYYPDIFRLVRCEVVPVICNYSINGDKLSYEIRCDIKILYCSESGNSLQCVTQRQNFSKTVELGRSGENLTARLTPKTDHINFRAVNKRRLDVRGAVSVKISVNGETNQEVISDAFGMNIQIKKTPVRFASKKITAEKTLQLSEDIEISPTQPTVNSIINIRCTVPECEKKMISGKLLAKGSAELKILYSCDKDGGAVEPVSFSMPFSQIIDIDGIDDTFDCTITPEVVSCDITPTADKNSENRIIKCEIELRLICCAVKTASVMLGTDAFSTVYPCNVTVSQVRAEQIPVIYEESFRHSAKISEGDSVPQTIYSMWCTPKNINTRLSDDGKAVIISGMLSYSMASRDNAGMIIMPDKDEAFEETINLPDNISGCTVSAEIAVRDVSYNISSEGILSAKSDISAKISVYSCSSINALTDIAVDESVKKQRDGDYAIKLYFGVENEEVWDIAKRYSTSVNAVIEENDLSGERLESGGMLLIPIVT